MPRYKNPSMQKLYDALLELADDLDSEMYYDGLPRRGAGHRCAFWDGFNGMERSANVIPGTLSHAAYMAGKEFKRREQA